jgi:hypothetical protein
LPHLPERSINSVRRSWIESEIDRAGVFIYK